MREEKISAKAAYHNIISDEKEGGRKGRGGKTWRAGMRRKQGMACISEGGRREKVAKGICLLISQGNIIYLS